MSLDCREAPRPRVQVEAQRRRVREDRAHREPRCELLLEGTAALNSLLTERAAPGFPDAARRGIPVLALEGEGVGVEEEAFKAPSCNE